MRIDLHRFPRGARWLLPTALLAIAPKCLLCVASYVGLGTALGLGGAEICGASAGPLGSWASALTWFGVAGALVTMGFLARHWRMRSGPPQR